MQGSGIPITSNQLTGRSVGRSDAICALSLLVLYSALRGFPPGAPVFPSHKKPTFDLT